MKAFFGYTKSKHLANFAPSLHTKAVIKSPLRYPGGKSKALTQILPLVPDYQEYREPFVGGGSVFLALKQQYPDKRYWINDLYEELFTFWKYTQNDLQSVVNQILEWKESFKKGKELHQFLIQNLPTLEGAEKASAFFVCNRITFSGTTEAGGFSEQAFQKRFTDSSIERLKLLANLMAEAKITNEDYQTVIEAEGKDVFIFLDPPYYSATKSALYGKNGKLHKIFDHERLAEVLQKCPHKWLMTYDNCEYIKNLFSFAHVKEWSLTYGMRNQTENSSQVGKELFISNFHIELQVTEKQPLTLSLFS